jgi:predicted HicB family RNase H-like nuclease
MDNQLQLFENPTHYIAGVPQYGDSVKRFLAKKEEGWEAFCKRIGIESEREFRKRMSNLRALCDSAVKNPPPHEP